ncbi:helix-turn-helix domain-containing protein [Lacticaseibacillus saniviri]
MVKFDLDFRIKVVKAYLDGQGSTSLARQFGIKKPATILLWVHRFEKFGVSGLYRQDHRPSYTRAFKLEVLYWMKQHQASYPETALHFNITANSTVWQWQKAVERDGTAGLVSKRRQANPMNKHKSKKAVQKPVKLTEDQKAFKKLQDENLKLRIENEYLKKLDALARQKSRQAKEQK